MILTVIREYGIPWIINRSLYSLKLKSLRILPFTECFYEKKIDMPTRIDLFEINAEHLKHHLNMLTENGRKRIIERADNAIAGRLICFSNIELNYGSPLNWQLNPLTGKICDIKRKWYEIPDFDEARGDIKIVWEASRFSHFVLFARAYYLTSNPKYYKSYKNQLADWIRKNPYSYGANYKCSQECSIRLANAMIAYAAFSALGCKDAEIESLLKRLVYVTYKKILSNFFYAHKCIKNDHTFSELMGMIICAWCSDDRRQLRWSGRILNKVIGDQFTEDGGYKSFSFNYEREIFQDIECILSIKEKIGLHLSDESVARLKNAILLLYQCQSENGDLPNYGSNDGALVFPLSSCNFNDYRPTLNSVYALLTGTQLYGAGKYQEELIWFGGKRSVNEFSVKNVERQSKGFSDAGLFTIRGDNTWAMVVLNDYKTRPSHMDQMHFDLWVNGINVFCDTGTYSYADKEGKNFIQNDFHNTVKIYGVSQMKTFGPFMVYGWPKRKKFQFDEKSFLGEIKFSNGYTHKRQVEYGSGEYIVTDTIFGENGKSFMIYFHTPCEAVIKETGIELTWNKDKIAEVSSDVKIEVCKAVRSLSYLQKEDINCLRITGSLNKQTTVKTVIKIFGGIN